MASKPKTKGGSESKRGRTSAASAELFKAVIEHSHDVIIFLDPERRIFYASPSITQISSYEPEELIGKSGIEFTHPDDRDATTRQFIDLLQTPGKSIAIEYRIKHKNGSWLWVDTRATNFLDHPQVHAVVLNIRDITERKQAEEKMRELEGRFREMLENVQLIAVLIDLEGRVTFCNEFLLQVTGYQRDEVLGSDWFTRFIPDVRPDVKDLFLRSLKQGNIAANYENPILTKRGEERFIRFSNTLLRDVRGDVIGTTSIGEDITERRQADARQTILYETLHAVSGYLDADAIARAAVDTIGRLSGWSSVAISLPNTEKETWQTRAGFGMLVGEYGEHRPMSKGVIGRTYRTGKTQNIPDVSQDPDYFRGDHPVTRSQLAVPIRGRERILGVINIESEYLDAFTSADVALVESLADTVSLALENARLYTAAQQEIDERIRAEQALRESETLYRQAIEVAGAVPYYESYYDKGTKINYDFIGEGIRKISGYGPEEFSAALWDKLILDIYPIDDLAGYSLDEAIQRVRSGESPIWKCEHRIRHRNGEIRWVFEAAVELRDERGVSHGSIGMYQDITERKNAEEALREAEAKYRSLVERLPQVIYTSELGTHGTWTFVSPQIEQMLGFTPQDWLADPDLWYRQVHPEDREKQLDQENEAYARAESFETEYRMLTRAGTWIWVRDSGRILPAQGEGKPIVQGTLTDITRSKQADEELTLSKAQLLANLNNTPNVAVQWFDKDGHILYWNPASESMYGWKSSEALGKTLEHLIHTPEEQAGFMQILADIQETGKPYGPYEAHIRRRDGSTGWVLATTFNMPMPDGQLGFVCMDVDINERKHAEELIHKQLQRLNALHTIDMAINSSTNIQITLEVLLSQILSQLNVDAVDVLLFNQPAQSLELTASRGFRSNTRLQSQQRLGDGFAGQVINDRRTVHISNLMETGKDLRQISMLVNDSFVEYFGLPLIAKGHIKGVLEIYHRSPLNPEDEWLNFLEVLAGQAAIAIDNAQLLQGLQRSNMEIVVAYDATIEGWSRAMDLRDKETEGHTQRVTTLTLKLARAMGIPESDILHIQRGGLLHDIGKLGVPDNILLKQAPLTDEEWAIMRQHPTYAFNMLSPIVYLKKALDIPYSHHEKWDGTGYPRGLQGEQISLAARIFAVVDVWDALTSDRPYRAAWTRDKTIAYIKEQSGHHFDPQVVSTFLTMIAAEG